MRRQKRSINTRDTRPSKSPKPFGREENRELVERMKIQRHSSGRERSIGRKLTLRNRRVPMVTTRHHRSTTTAPVIHWAQQARTLNTSPQTHLLPSIRMRRCLVFTDPLTLTQKGANLPRRPTEDRKIHTTCLAALHPTTDRQAGRRLIRTSNQITSRKILQMCIPTIRRAPIRPQCTKHSHPITVLRTAASHVKLLQKKRLRARQNPTIMVHSLADTTFMDNRATPMTNTSTRVHPPHEVTLQSCKLGPKIEKKGLQDPRTA
mmetsp:Transcript_5964/g.17952  ORF Transcript_5964/g.17952 Transcript_5964/m.17952 type:complete len:263 (-) Transcript_5964:525-1313(-)